jgi:muramoyltetrapeptide carboxypeptidase LdcA involved in peptidoglycan recycling
MAQGRLLAIRPGQLLDMLAAGFELSLKDRIWCLEPVDVRALRQVYQRGLLGRVAGIVAARLFSYDGQPNKSTEQSDATLKEITAEIDVPILADVDCGHTIPRLTIPNGVLATLDSQRNLFSFDEPAVTVAAGD